LLSLSGAAAVAEDLSRAGGRRPCSTSRSQGDKNTAAAAFFALGEAIVVSGFGVVIGEKAGASEAAGKLR
jgi:hypothetical protein